MKKIVILLVTMLAISIIMIALEISDREGKISCANCCAWYLPQDMKKVTLSKKIGLDTDLDCCFLVLCKECIKNPENLNLRHIEKHERAERLPEDHVVAHSFIAYLLKEGKEDKIEITKLWSEGE